MKLRDYQEQSVDFLYERDRAMILASVGDGNPATNYASAPPNPNRVRTLARLPNSLGKSDN